MKTLAFLIMRLIKHEWHLIRRQPEQVLRPLGLFAVAFCLFAVALPPKTTFWQSVGPGVLWFIVTMILVQGLDRLLQAEFAEGAIEQWLLCPYPLPLVVFIKVWLHWLVTGLPMILLTPLFAYALGLSPQAIVILCCSLLLGTPSLCFLGAIISTLTLGLRQAGLLTAMVLFPLFVPILIFGTSSVLQAGQGGPVALQLAMLAAILLLSVVFSPILISMAWRLVVI